MSIKILIYATSAGGEEQRPVKKRKKDKSGKKAATAAAVVRLCWCLQSITPVEIFPWLNIFAAKCAQNFRPVTEETCLLSRGNNLGGYCKSLIDNASFAMSLLLIPKA